MYHYINFTTLKQLFYITFSVGSNLPSLHTPPCSEASVYIFLTIQVSLFCQTDDQQRSEEKILKP